MDWPPGPSGVLAAAALALLAVVGAHAGPRSNG